MIITRIMAMLPLAFSLAGVLHAATPEQVGTYTGSVKSVQIGATGKNTEKFDMTLEIAADDSTTITIAGTPQELASEPFYNAKDGGFIYALENGPLTSIHLAELTFKGTSIKGSSVGVQLIGGSTFESVIERKFKLKKQ